LILLHDCKSVVCLYFERVVVESNNRADQLCAVFQLKFIGTRVRSQPGQKDRGQHELQCALHLFEYRALARGRQATAPHNHSVSQHRWISQRSDERSRERCGRIPEMIVVAVLVISLLLFRAAGALGVAALASWVAATRYALATMFITTGTGHFNHTRFELERMVPQVFPHRMAIVYFTGICEFAGAVGIVIPQFRNLAGICLIVLLIVMLPANIKAAQEGLQILGRPATPLLIRVPLQIVFIGLIWWSTLT